eukprot:scaffold68268_cov76-Phaeocystis_antarctica.AAC.3
MVRLFGVVEAVVVETGRICGDHDHAVNSTSFRARQIRSGGNDWRSGSGRCLLSGAGHASSPRA